MTASSEVKKAAQDKLTRWIDLDQRVVSYRELARELGLNINVAKKPHFRENTNLFPTYLMTGRYLPTIKSLHLTQTQSATQNIAAPSSTEETGTADKMEVDTQEDAPENDRGKTPTKAQEGSDESKAEIGTRNVNDGWPLKDEKIVAKGMLLIGGQEEMEAKKSLFVEETLHVQIHSLSAFRISDPGNYLASTVRLRTVTEYNDANTYGTITGSFEMATAKPNGRPTKPSAATSKPVPAKAKTSAFSKPAVVPKPTITASETAKSKGKAKATKQDDDEPMLKPGKLSSRNSKRVIRSESPEEEEPPEPRQIKQKPVAVSMPTNTSSKPLQDLEIGEEDRLAMEAMMDMSDNFDMPSSSAMVQPMDDEEESEGAPSRNKKRTLASRTAEQAAEVPEQRDLQGAKIGSEGKVLKKRRVTKSVERKNKRGFSYFEDVSTDEEYWSDGTSTTAPIGKKATGKVNTLKRNASTTSVSTKGEDDAESPSESQASAVGKKPGAVKTKASAAVTSGTKTGGTGKTSATGSKPAPKKGAGQQSMFSYFKKQ